MPLGAKRITIAQPQHLNRILRFHNIRGKDWEVVNEGYIARWKCIQAIGE